MNIIFFTQEDPFYVKIFFEEFFEIYRNLDDIKAIVISKTMGKKSILALAKQMYGLYGPYNFIRIGLKYVYYKLMSNLKVSKTKNRVIFNKSLSNQYHSPLDIKHSKTYSVKQLIEYYGIKVIERSDLNSKDFLAYIKSYNADLFISVASPIIFKNELINIPNIECINIHNAPLPKYRGMLPNFWQLYHGEKESGITVHRIVSGIDTGEILIQEHVPIETKETLNSLIIKTKKQDAFIISKIIEQFRKGKIIYKKMEGKGSYFSFPKRKHVKEFLAKGGRII